eukprot:821528-Pleurochrysis_carterae.AAC.1
MHLRYPRVPPGSFPLRSVLLSRARAPRRLVRRRCAVRSWSLAAPPGAPRRHRLPLRRGGRLLRARPVP